MSPEIRDLYGEYARGGMDRREFLGRLAALAGGTAAAAVLLPALEAAGPGPQLTAKDDPRLETGYVKYPIEGGEMRAYSAKPKGAAKLAGVIVIHENRGLNPHTEDLARRVAIEGYHAIAPDALSLLGGTPENPDEARPLFQKLDREANTKNFAAAVAYLKTEPQATGKVGCMGFCWGGAVTNQVAVNAPDLTAAVPFYGSQPGAKTSRRSRRPCSSTTPATTSASTPASRPSGRPSKRPAIEHTIHVYEGAGHAFMNDTGQRYNKEAAELGLEEDHRFPRRTSSRPSAGPLRPAPLGRDRVDERTHVVEERFISRAEIVQGGPPVRRGDEAVLRALPVAHGQDLARPADARQALALGPAEGPLGGAFEEVWERRLARSSRRGGLRRRSDRRNRSRRCARERDVAAFRPEDAERMLLIEGGPGRFLDDLDLDAPDVPRRTIRRRRRRGNRPRLPREPRRG